MANLTQPAMAEFLSKWVGVEAPNPDDYHGLSMAYDAALLSDDPRTQVGAYINGSMGWNRQVDLHPPVQDKDWARVHAETDALLRTEWTQGGTLYAPWACCVGCATDILAAGIERVVIHEERMLLTPREWESTVISGLRMLIRNEVTVDCYSAYFGVNLRAHGEEVEV